MDLGFIDIARVTETEAIEGGRALSEFSFGPAETTVEDEEPILDRSVDDVQETDERLESLPRYIAFAQTAYEQRGLKYPFILSPSGDSLDIVPGREALATKSAELSGMVGKGDKTAKDFESRAFRTLHHFVGGWGACVGHPRTTGHGPAKTVKQFRESLRSYEKGGHLPIFAPSGDLGLDGFVVLGREWGGPVLFFQSKNTGFDIHDYPNEFGRVRPILQDWFGRRLNRSVIPVLAINTVLTLEAKEEIFDARGAAAYHVVDSVDILSVENGASSPFSNQTCRVL